MNIKTKTVKKGTQNIQKSQQRYRQKSKVTSQARVSTQAQQVSGKNPKTLKQAERYTGRQRELE